MGLGLKKLKDVEFERFNDVLADAQRAVHKDQKIIYVDSNTGNDNYNGLRLRYPKATIAGAIAACTASQGDRIIVLPNHVETVTSAVSLSKADVALIGMELGNKRPVITVNGAVDLLSVSGAGCAVSGLDLTIVTTDNATALIDVSAAKVKLQNIKMIPSATSVNVVDCITVASGADDCHIEDVRIHNTVVAVNSFLSIEAAVARLVVKGCHFSGDVVTAGIIDAATATQIRLLGNVVKTIGTNIPACILDSNPTGEAIGNYMFGTDATITNDAQWGTALILANNYTRGGTGSSVSASNIIPALDT